MICGIERFGQPRQIGPHAVDPHGVGIEMEERLVAQQRQRLDDGAAGAEHLIALVGDDHAGPGAGRGMLDDLVGQIMHIDHGFADAGAGELVQHMIEQGLAGHAHQRLRHMVGQGPHSHAETGGEDHGFDGRNGHFRKFLEYRLALTDHTTVIRLNQPIRRHSHGI